MAQLLPSDIRLASLSARTVRPVAGRSLIPVVRLQLAGETALGKQKQTVADTIRVLSLLMKLKYIRRIKEQLRQQFVLKC